jgi:WD40 repeat protein
MSVVGVVTEQSQPWFKISALLLYTQETLACFTDTVIHEEHKKWVDSIVYEVDGKTPRVHDLSHLWANSSDTKYQRALDFVTEQKSVKHCQAVQLTGVTCEYVDCKDPSIIIACDTQSIQRDIKTDSSGHHGATKIKVKRIRRTVPTCPPCFNLYQDIEANVLRTSPIFRHLKEYAEANATDETLQSAWKRVKQHTVDQHSIQTGNRIEAECFLHEPWSVARMLFNGLGDRRDDFQSPGAATASNLDFQNLQALIIRCAWFHNNPTDYFDDVDSYYECMIFLVALNQIRNDVVGHPTWERINQTEESFANEVADIVGGILGSLKASVCAEATAKVRGFDKSLASYDERMKDRTYVTALLDVSDQLAQQLGQQTEYLVSFRNDVMHRFDGLEAKVDYGNDAIDGTKAIAADSNARIRELQNDLQVYSLKDVYSNIRSCLSKYVIPEPFASQIRLHVPVRCSTRPHDPDAKLRLDTVLEKLLHGTTSRSQLLTDLDSSDSKQHCGSSSQIRVLLIEGIAGSGKSLSSYAAVKSAIKSGLSATMLPLFISLPHYASHAKSGTLMRHALQDKFCIPHRHIDDTLDACKSGNFLIILDGLDELNDRSFNVIMHNNLHLWQNSVLCITSRTGFLHSASDVINLIAPKNDALPQTQQVLRLYLQPFDQHEQQQLVGKQFSSAGEADAVWKQIQSLKSLAELTKNPLTLFMMLQVLPQLSARQFISCGDETVRVLDTDSLRVVPVSDSNVRIFGSLLRAELYALFIHDWIERQTKKCIDDGLVSHDQQSGMCKEALAWCQKLAFQMFLHNFTRVDVAENSHDQGDTDMSDMDDLSSDEDENDDVTVGCTTSASQSAVVPESILHLLKDTSYTRTSPLIRSGTVYAFLHKSIQEYLAALYVASDVSKRCEHKKWPKFLKYEDKIHKLHVSTSALLRDPAVLLFAAELVHARDVTLQRYQPMDEKTGRPRWPVCSWGERKELGFAKIQPLTKALFDLIEASKHHADVKTGVCPEHIRIAAGNAITILNYANVCFSGMQLDGIQIGSEVSSSAMSLSHEPDDGKSIARTRHANAATASIPFADLSHSVLNNVSLCNSNLAGACMANTLLDSANVGNSCMEHTSFGQLPMLRGHSRPVNHLVFSGSATPRRLFSAGDDCTIRVWDVESRKCIRTLQGHSRNISSLAYDSTHRTLFSASEDKTIRIWTESGKCINILEGHCKGVTCLIFDSTTQTLYSGSWDMTVRAWQVDEHGNCVNQYCIDGHRACGHSLVVDSKAQVLYCISADRFDHSIHAWDIRRQERTRTLSGHSEPVLTLAFDSNTQTLYSGAGDSTIRLWSVKSGECIQSLCHSGHSEMVTSLAFDSATQSLYSASADGAIHIWAAQSGECVNTLRNPNGIKSIVFDDISRILYANGDDKNIRSWHVDGAKCVKRRHGHSGRVLCLAFGSSSRVLYSGSADGSICAWNIDSGECIKTLQEKERWPVDSLVLHSTAHAQTLYSCTCENTIRVWDYNRGIRTATLQGHTDVVNCLVFDSKTCRLYSGSYDCTIRVWDCNNNTHIGTLSGHSDWVSSLAFDSKTCRLYSGSNDCTIRVWDGSNNTHIRTLSGHSDWVISLAFDSKTCRLYSGSNDCAIRAWDSNTGRCIHTLDDYSDFARSLAFDSKTATLYVGSQSGSIQAYNVKGSEFQLTDTLQGHASGISGLAIDSVTRNLYSGSWDGSVHAWHMNGGTGAGIKVLQGHSDHVICLAYARDCTSQLHTVFSGAGDNTIRAWNIDSGECMWTRDDHSGKVICLAADAKTRTLYSGAQDTTIRVWNSDTGEFVKALHGHTNVIRTLEIDHSSSTLSNGRMLYSGSYDKTIRMWNVEDGVCLKVFEGHSRQVQSLAFDPITQSLFSASFTGPVLVWNVATAKVINKLESPSPGTRGQLSFDSEARILQLGGTVYWNVSVPTSCTVVCTPDVFKPCNSSASVTDGHLTLPDDREVHFGTGSTVEVHTGCSLQSRFVWRSSSSTVLSAKHCSIRDTGLSSVNRSLLQQHGAQS